MSTEQIAVYVAMTRLAWAVVHALPPPADNHAKQSSFVDHRRQVAHSHRVGAGRMKAMVRAHNVGVGLHVVVQEQERAAGRLRRAVVARRGRTERTLFQYPD